MRTLMSISIEINLVWSSHLYTIIIAILIRSCFTHFTADSLVPIDQVTRKYTYEVNGDSIPRELSTRMSDYDLPAGADKSMDELLPPEQIHMTCIKVEEIGAGTTVQAPFDPREKI